jgi:hypothetical protein
LLIIEHSIFTRNARFVDVILFEKVSDACRLALFVDIADPIYVHDPSQPLSSSFAASDDPIDGREIRPEIKPFKERLGRNEADRRRNGAKDFDAP